MILIGKARVDGMVDSLLLTITCTQLLSVLGSFAIAYVIISKWNDKQIVPMGKSLVFALSGSFAFFVWTASFVFIR